MKKHRPMGFISKQTRDTHPTNDNSANPSTSDDAVHLDATSSPVDLPQLSPSLSSIPTTSTAEIHCSSESCRDLTRSNQSMNSAVLCQTTKTQGTGYSQKNKQKKGQFNHIGSKISSG